MLRGQWSPDSLNVCHCRVSTGVGEGVMVTKELVL